MARKKDLQWIENYNILKSLFEEKGHCIVKKKNCDKSLYAWICIQRMNKKDGTLRADREKLLTEIDFYFNESWEDMFEIFMKYFNLHNSFIIPKDNEYYPLVGKWIEKQLKLFSKNQLTADKQSIYLKLGLNIERKSSLEDKWNENFIALKNFFKKNNTNTITREHKSLYRFTQTQRTNFKNGTLSHNRIQLLTEIGFIFDIWHSQYICAQEYYTIHKHLFVPTSSKEYSKLRNWINNTRVMYKKGELNAVQLKLLEEICFPFEVIAQDKSWLNNYNKATKVFLSDKYCSINIIYFSLELFYWSLEQCDIYHNGEMSNYQIGLLNKINFDFNLNQIEDITISWIKKYKKIQSIYNEYQHYYIDYSSKESYLLWILELCDLKKSNQLSSNQLILLNKINFDFNIKDKLDIDDEWLKKFKYYKRKYLKAPVDFSTCSLENFKWIKTQAKLYKKNLLSEYKYNLLNSVNFDFERIYNIEIDCEWFKFFTKLKYHYCRAKNYYLNPFDNGEDFFEWAVTQTALMQNNKLNIYKKTLLDSINFNYCIYPLSKEEKQWFKHYNKIKLFRKKYGHCIIDSAYASNGLLQWMYEQNYLKENGALREDFKYYLSKIDLYKENKLPPIILNLFESLSINSGQSCS